MKLAAICFHKDARRRYPFAWLEHYSQSIRNQTVPVDLFELDYGGGDTRLLDGMATAWWSSALPNHAHAQNLMLDEVFAKGYDAALNTNIDDFYSPEYAAVSARQIEAGVALSSSNFMLVDADARPVHAHSDLHQMDISVEMSIGHNIICHPTVAYSREFWAGCSRYRPDEVPEEDLRLWQREIGRFRFGIAPEVLVSHRIHENSVCAEAGR